jgi:CheY-like chemotaxis protein
LPASDKAAVKEEPASVRIVRGTETLMLVEDEDALRELNRELLESLGYAVLAAGSGREAIAIFEQKLGAIDLVILDMVMPGISGSRIFDRLRAIDPEVKVLLYSGYSLNGEAQLIMNRGCNGFLHKPFTIEQLSRKIREILETRPQPPGGGS